MSTRNISISIIWTLIVLLLMDAYVYSALRKSIQKSKWKPYLNIAFIVSVIMSYIGFYYFYFYFTVKPLRGELAPNLAIGFFFSFMAVKILLVLFFLFEDVFRLLELLFNVIKSFIITDKQKVRRPGRRGFIRTAGLIVAGIPFTSMLYGITKGKYDFRVKKVKLAFDNLPKAFEGFKGMNYIYTPKDDVVNSDDVEIVTTTEKDTKEVENILMGISLPKECFEK